MEKVLVLRLLIYGIVTQVADKDHACGNAGIASSFRRPDGITIVCLPLPNETGDGSDMHNLSNQGITLRITPNQNKNERSVVVNGMDKSGKSKENDSDFLHTTTIPIDLSKIKDFSKKHDEKSSKEIGSEEVDEEEEEEEEEEISKPRALKRTNKFERSIVEYDPDKEKKEGKDVKDKKIEDEEEDEEVVEDKKKKEDKKPKLKLKRENDAKSDSSGEHKSPISLSNLPQMINENDDEIEQYILIRRRKKKKDEQMKNDIMLPLASSNLSLADDNDGYKTTKRPTKRKKNLKKTKKNAEDEDNSGNKNLKIDEHDIIIKLEPIKPKSKSQKRDLAKEGEESYDYGGKVGDNQDGPDKSKKKTKRKTKKKKKKVDEEQNGNRNESEKASKKDKRDDEYSSKDDYSADKGPKSNKQQIFIINVPITHHSNYSTTITMPETKTDKKNEEEFSKFLNAFNFTPDDGEPMVEHKDTDSEDHQEGNYTDKMATNEHVEDDDNSKSRSAKKSYKNKNKIFDEKGHKKEFDEMNVKDEEEETTSPKPDTIYNLLLSNQINNSGKRKSDSQKEDLNKLNKDVEYLISVAHPSDEKDPIEKIVETNSNRPNGNSVYKLVKITNLMVQHNNTDGLEWPKKEFHKEFNQQFNHSFQKESKSSSGNYFQKKKEKASTFGENDVNINEDQSNDPVVWKMMKKIQHEPWYKTVDDSKAKK